MNENSSQTIKELSEDKEIKNSSELDNDSLSQNEDNASYEKNDIPSADSSSSRTNADFDNAGFTQEEFASLLKVVFSQALDMPVNSFCLLNNSLLPSFLITETGIVSTLSYVVNLKLQFKHSLLLRTLLPLSADLDSKTLLSVF